MILLSDTKGNILKYFKNQLYLLGDICHNNSKTLELIKNMFPIPEIIYNLGTEELDLPAKIGFARILTSLFENTEKLMFVKKPKLQQLWEDEKNGRGRVSKYMQPEDLEKLKELITNFFNNDPSVGEPYLQYEILRLLSYLVRCDFIFAKAESALDWKEKLTKSYTVISSAFSFCFKYLQQLAIERDNAQFKRTHTSRKLNDENDAEEINITPTQPAVTEEQMEDARNNPLKIT